MKWNFALMCLLFNSFVFAQTRTLAGEGISIIVHRSNPIENLSPGQISEYFLKKIRNWPNGQPIRFFDRQDNSPERALFLELFMKRSHRELEQYWIGQKLNTGNSAPSQVPTDSMTYLLVSRFQGGIGYVKSGFKIGEGVKKINISGK